MDVLVTAPGKVITGQTLFFPQGKTMTAGKPGGLHNTTTAFGHDPTAAGHGSSVIDNGFSAARDGLSAARDDKSAAHDGKSAAKNAQSAAGYGQTAAGRGSTAAGYGPSAEAFPPVRKDTPIFHRRMNVTRSDRTLSPDNGDPVQSWDSVATFQESGWR